ncbi:hypothetical protein GCM10025868_12520 [Angustibacter aerolatus]|uniref:SH3 domain-containing protein n=1 Tax=Angustibacter aerolatus TaxID=1162965 RepID=A0ABQ6JDY4_9ACTN|nr:hypothetical protein GCM10025868_12520 [Angustibacter aerolatus]
MSLLDRRVGLRDGSGDVVVEDVAISQIRTRDWQVQKVFVRRFVEPRRLGGRIGRRRGEAFVVEADQVDGLSIESGPQGAAGLLASFGSLKAADIADLLHDLSPKRRVEVAAALDDEKLADVLEEPARGRPGRDPHQARERARRRRARGDAARRRGRPAARAARRDRRAPAAGSWSRRRPSRCAASCATTRTPPAA